MLLLQKIKTLDELFVDFVRAYTTRFIKSKLGQMFLSLTMVGPLTFIPQVWTAFTAENIDSLRTLTWPFMVVVNSSVLIGMCHYGGDWRLRLSMVMWIMVMALIWLATIFR